jgi:hypothetical protein
MIPLAIYISPKIRAKLESKHGVTEEEVRQCFANMPDGYEFIRDVREKHQTNPPTFFFLADTNRRRKLKICFMAVKVKTPDGEKTRIDIKTAYPPDQVEIDNYEKFGKSG